MALRSMTGYGRGQATLRGIRAEVQVSSVNRRQLDIHLNMPRSLAALDSQLTEEVQAAATRGRITVDVRVAFSVTARKAGIRVDEELAGAYLDALRRTASRLDLADDLRASLLLNLPDVVRYEQGDDDVERAWPPVKRALRKALRELIAMRIEEGAELQRDIESRVDLLEQECGRIRDLAPRVATQYQAALAKRLERMGIPLQDADDRLLREVAIYADRADISEELTRLESHVKQARSMLGGRRASGKSLDFLAQEMFREVNTIGSKANDSKIAHHVIRCKTELERIREQVQNVE